MILSNIYGIYVLACLTIFLNILLICYTNDKGLNYFELTYLSLEAMLLKYLTFTYTEVYLHYTLLKYFGYVLSKIMQVNIHCLLHMGPVLPVRKLTVKTGTLFQVDVVSLKAWCLSDSFCKAICFMYN